MKKISVTMTFKLELIVTDSQTARDAILGLDYNFSAPCVEVMNSEIANWTITDERETT